MKNKKKKRRQKIRKRRRERERERGRRAPLIGVNVRPRENISYGAKLNGPCSNSFDERSVCSPYLCTILPREKRKGRERILLKGKRENESGSFVGREKKEGYGER